MNKSVWYYGEDQYGNSYHHLRYPRKQLMQRLDCKHADKMYETDKFGNNFHVGYVIQGHWIRLYIVTPFKVDAKW